MPEASSSRDLVGSLEKGLGVIEILAAHPAGLTLTDTAERAGLTRAGARRLLLTLVAAGYAGQDGRVFALSPKLLSLSRAWLEGTSLWSFAEPFMREVAAAMNESCSAAVLSGHDVVYVARIPGARIMRVALQVGTRLPAYCTSMGRVLMSGMTQEQLADFLGSVELIAHTPKTVIDGSEIARRVRQAAEQGFAVVDEELEIGLRSIAVPIRDRQGTIVAAINVSTQSARFSVAEMKRTVLPPLKQAAERIEDFFALQ
ncbi:IclR family transcriptional regulator C-terminal domain-containing protein [Mesorhizobium sp. LHD-90]|uniref:IclR family transcriptional regulator domain-containing protein n=1 Tax=Mesorhizobium sp. LHD-90 TaxID=3071414 RepID=UPI0027DF8DE2|nr:IclR family transcriptional regulator C-terminal domain-containing protein [Mesorhizobium sp. LHD-90]MDQ6433297.1 IclR family transcriptional regulator C-terminal domain-containing protein [Mesorhizobium sp. LHD-90]